MLAFMGGFRIFHLGHKAVIDKALELADEVVVVIGSQYAPRSPKIPFTANERQDFIRAVYPDEPRLKITTVPDFPYSDEDWIASVEAAVESIAIPGNDIGLIGHSKDQSSYYLNIFPKWGTYVEVENMAGINATDIRQMLYRKEPSTWVDFVPEQTVSLVEAIISNHPQEWQNILDWNDDLLKTKSAWSASPYPPIFTTVDVCAIHAGCVLLIERGGPQGRGLWALPGGFLEQYEVARDGALREFYEEVVIPGVSVTIGDPRVFDRPDRSERGRTISIAYPINVKYSRKGLPSVRGTDDATRAFWQPLHDLPPAMFFEDHASIIDHFVNNFR